MSCDGSDSVSVIHTTAKRIKDGKLRRHKDKLFGDKWPETYAVLYQDSTFIWYDDETERTPKGSLQLKDCAPFLAVGVYSTRLPDRPNLPSRAKIDHVLAIGTGPKSKIHWFLCQSDEELNTWMMQIISTLPPPPQSQQPPPAQMPPAYNQAGPNYGPPPTYGATMGPAPQTTVVVDQSGGGAGGPGFGTGMLAGGLLGYGLAGVTHPWGMFGCGYGWGGGPHYGGGVYDNDTTIVNNYNTTNTTNTDDNYQQTDDHNEAGEEGECDYDGGDFDYGDDFGGDMSGGF